MLGRDSPVWVHGMPAIIRAGSQHIIPEGQSRCGGGPILHTVQVKARTPSTPLLSKLSTPHCLPPALQHIRTGLKAELDAQEVAAEKDEEEPLQFVVLDLSASPSEC